MDGVILKTRWIADGEIVARGLDAPPSWEESSGTGRLSSVAFDLWEHIP